MITTGLRYVRVPEVVWEKWGALKPREHDAAAEQLYSAVSYISLTFSKSHSELSIRTLFKKRTRSNSTKSNISVFEHMCLSDFSVEKLNNLRIAFKG